MDRFREEGLCELARNCQMSRELAQGGVDEETGCTASEMAASWMDADDTLPLRRAQMLAEPVLAQRIAVGLAAVGLCLQEG